MKTGLLGMVLFAAGMGSGWLLKPAAPDPDAPAPDQAALRPVRTGGNRQAEPADKEHLGSLLSQLATQAQRSFPGREAPPGPTIEPEDYPKLLDALQQRAGLSGLAWNDKNVFGKLLGDWYAIDPSRAANWVRGMKNPNDRRELGEVLIAAAVKKDYGEAVRLMQDFSVSDDGVVQIPESLMSAAAKLGAEELVKLCSMSVSKGGASGNPISYPDGFDFRPALEGLIGMKAKGIELATYPSNLLEEWAKRSPEAAFDWYARSDAKGIFFSLGNYFSNLAESAPPEELASKVALAMTTGGDHDRLLDEIAGGMASTSPDPVLSLLSRLPQDLDQTNLRVAFMNGSGWEGDERASYREGLLADLAADERVALMQSLFRDGKPINWNQASLDSLEKTLIKLGHSTDEAGALVPDEPKREAPGFSLGVDASFDSGFIESESDDDSE